MKLSEACYRAAEIMARKGHCKGTLENQQGEVCFNGALILAVTGAGSVWRDLVSPWEPVLAAGEAARKILESRGYEPGYEPPNGYSLNLAVRYNNDPATSGEDVILLLKETGHALEEDGS